MCLSFRTALRASSPKPCQQEGSGNHHTRQPRRGQLWHLGLEGTLKILTRWQQVSGELDFNWRQADLDYSVKTFQFYPMYIIKDNSPAVVLNRERMGRAF